jgi:hypothetical protein
MEKREENLRAGVENWQEKENNILATKLLYALVKTQRDSITFFYRQGLAYFTASKHRSNTKRICGMRIYH